MKKQRKTKTSSSKRPLYYQNCLRIFAHFQWMRGEKVPRESKKCPGTLWGFSSIFVRAHKDSSRCCQAESLGLLLLSPSSLLFKSVNLQYNTLGCLDHGTNESSTKRLMFQVLFFFMISCKILCKNPFNLFSYFFFITKNKHEKIVHGILYG